MSDSLAPNFLESFGVSSSSSTLLSSPPPLESDADLYLSRAFVSGTRSRLMTVFSTMHDIRITMLQKDLNTNSSRFFSKALDKEKLEDEAKRSQLSDQTAERFIKALVYGLSVPDDKFEITEDEKEGITITFPIVPTIDDAIHNLTLPESLPVPQLDLFDSYQAVFQALQKLQSQTYTATLLPSIDATLDLEPTVKQPALSSATTNHQVNLHRDVFNPLQGVVRAPLAGTKRKR